MWSYDYHTHNFVICEVRDPGGQTFSQRAHPISPWMAQQLLQSQDPNWLLALWESGGLLARVCYWYTRLAWKQAGWVL